MFRLSVCADTVFQHLPFEERVREIARAGFWAEFWLWQGRDIEALANDPAVPVSAFTGYLGGSLVQGIVAPRLDGLKSWSAEDIAAYLQSGRNGKSHAGELMSKVAVNSMPKTSDADARAIGVYLKDLPGAAR